MNLQKMMSLFAAHTPSPEKFKLRSEHAYTENMSIATLIKSPDNVIPAFNHSHDLYEFIIPHTHIPFLIRDNATYFGEVGWIYPVPPGLMHGMKYDTPDVSHTNIVIDKKYFDGVLKEQGVNEIILNHILPISSDIKIYISVFKAEFAKVEVNRQKLRHLSALICYELIGLATVNLDLDERKDTDYYYKGIREAAEFMNNNYMNGLSIESLAKMAGLSTNYFSTAFLKALGDRPQIYLDKLRISRAKQLLESSNVPINEIAQMCGFKNQSSFTMLFKHMTGQTPTEYRNSLKEYEDN